MIFNTPTIAQDKLIEAPTCPKCRKVLSGFTGVNVKYWPERGDFTACGYCTEILRFTDGMQLRVVTDQDAVSPETREALTTAARLFTAFWMKRTEVRP